MNDAAAGRNQKSPQPQASSLDPQSLDLPIQRIPTGEQDMSKTIT